MVGHSRKSFLADVCGNDMNKRDIETVNISNKLIANGVDIVRIHNMKKHAEHLNWSLK
jgi:dihydropteroate synthase